MCLLHWGKMQIMFLLQHVGYVVACLTSGNHIFAILCSFLRHVPSPIVIGTWPNRVDGDTLRQKVKVIPQAFIPWWLFENCMGIIREKAKSPVVTHSWHTCGHRGAWARADS